MPASNGTRFELPALKPVNFSLTEGTDIPPPPDSPVEEEAPPPPAKLPPVQTTPLAPINGNSPARGRTTSSDNPPLSPASTARPSSIRRFLSRTSLNANYTNGTTHNVSSEDLNGRPESPSFFGDGRPGLKKTKSGSWFKRLGSLNRNSVIYENSPLVEEKDEPMGPPPPRLPELNQLKNRVSDNDEGSLGADDMFKNIK